MSTVTVRPATRRTDDRGMTGAYKPLQAHTNPSQTAYKPIQAYYKALQTNEPKWVNRHFPKNGGRGLWLILRCRGGK